MCKISIAGNTWQPFIILLSQPSLKLITAQHSSYYQHNTRSLKHGAITNSTWPQICLVIAQTCPVNIPNHCSHSSAPYKRPICPRSAALSADSYPIHDDIRITVDIALAFSLYVLMRWHLQTHSSSLAGKYLFIPTRSAKYGFLNGWRFARQHVIGSVNGDDFRSYTTNMIMNCPHRTISVRCGMAPKMVQRQ